MGAKKKLTGNELIANFMNLKCENSYIKLWMPSGELNSLNNLIHDEMEDETWYVTTLKFDESWNWLMPVVEKIEEMDVVASFQIEQPTIYIWASSESSTFEDIEIDIFTKSKIEAVYEACIKFIKWYNGNK